MFLIPENYFLGFQGNFTKILDGFAVPYIHITDYSFHPELQGEAVNTCKNADATKINSEYFF